MDDTRVYNKRNELRERSVLDSTNPTTPRIVALDYDRNGNLTSDGEKHTYTFNPFGQLVRINDFATGDLIARFTYNGLGQRISEQTDVNRPGNTGEPDGLVTTSDPVFYLAVDPQGRRVATYRDQDRHPKETFVWTLAGISGPGGVANGTLILRDRNENGADPLAWATVEGSDARPERHYSVSDHTGSVVALLGLHNVNDAPTAKLAEQYRYSVTGVPYGIPLGDVNANGQVEDGGGFSPDKNIVADMAASSVYQVRGDVNLDGLVDWDDVAIVDGQFGVSLGRGSSGSLTVRFVSAPTRILTYVTTIHSPLPESTPLAGRFMTPQPGCGPGTGAGGGGVQIPTRGYWAPPVRSVPHPRRLPSQVLPRTPNPVPSIRPGPTIVEPMRPAWYGPSLPPHYRLPLAPLIVPHPQNALPASCAPNPAQPFPPEIEGPPWPYGPEPQDGWPDGFYGDCTPQQAQNIRAEIGKLCKGPKFSCKDLPPPSDSSNSVDPCAVYCDRADAGNECKRARLRYRDECWRGAWPPPSLAEPLTNFPFEIENLITAVSRCQEMCDSCRQYHDLLK
jgi:YD repeat-containing protein